VPWPVYTERVLHHQASGIWYWTVPEHKRFIASDVSALNGAAAGASFELYIGTIAMDGAVFQATKQLHLWTGKQVAYQGERLQLYISHDGLHVTVTGSLLDDASSATGPPGAAGGRALPEAAPLPAQLLR
jgi:hypothetical protein